MSKPSSLDTVVRSIIREELAIALGQAGVKAKTAGAGEEANLTPAQKAWVTRRRNASAKKAGKK